MNIKEKVLADYDEHIGKLLLVKYICGHEEFEDSQEQYFQDDPILVRVIDTDEQSITRRNGDRWDPRWNVEPLEERNELSGWSSFYIDGISYIPTEQPPAWDRVPPMKAFLLETIAGQIFDRGNILMPQEAAHNLRGLIEYLNTIEEGLQFRIPENQLWASGSIEPYYTGKYEGVGLTRSTLTAFFIAKKIVDFLEAQ